MARKEIESAAEDRAEGYKEEPGERSRSMPTKGKSKVKSKGSLQGAHGGSGSMVGRQYAGPQKPGVTSHDVSGSGGKFASGGSGKMVSKQEASPAKPA